MYQICTAQNVNQTIDIFTLLEYWLENYKNKEPEENMLAVVDNLASEYRTKNLLNNKQLLNKLKEWAKENKKIVIVSSCSVIVFAAATITLNSPIATILDKGTGETSIVLNATEEQSSNSLEAGLYQVDENNNIIGENGETSNSLINTQYDSKKGKFLFLDNNFFEGLLHRNSVLQLLEDKVEEAKRLSEEEERIKKELEEQKREELRLSEEKKYIEFYCSVYGLNYESVYQALSNLTDNFKSEEYLNGWVIGDSILKGRYITCDSKEMAILIAVRNIYYDPARYGCSKENLYTGIEYKTDLDYSHQIGYLSNVLGVDPCLNWAICNAECSFKSSLFVNSHNPAGLNFGNGFASFPSCTAGFIEESLELVKYKLMGRTTIKSIGDRHAPVYEDEEGNLVNAHWIPNVTGGYNTATRNYESFFGNTDELSFFPTIPEENVVNENTEDIHEIEKIIRLYCNIYELNYNVVYKILSDNTDGFTSEAYINDNYIPLSKIGNEIVLCDSKEKAILLAIHNIYNNPISYGYTTSEIRTANKYMSSKSNSAQIAYFSNVLGVDAALNYAICQTESDFSNPIYNLLNNPSGIKKDNTYVKYPNITVGFIEQSIKLLEIEQGSSVLSFDRLRLEYEKSEASNWKNDLISIYNYISDNYETIFGESNNQHKKAYIKY